MEPLVVMTTARRSTDATSSHAAWRLQRSSSRRSSRHSRHDMAGTAKRSCVLAASKMLWPKCDGPVGGPTCWLAVVVGRIHPVLIYERKDPQSHGLTMLEATPRMHHAQNLTPRATMPRIQNCTEIGPEATPDALDQRVQVYAARERQPWPRNDPTSDPKIRPLTPSGDYDG